MTQGQTVIPPQLVLPLTKECILVHYADVFTGIGKLEGEIHLEVDASVKPVQLPPRRVPFAIKDKLKQELEEMCKNGILEPVSEPSSWMSALVVVTKAYNKQLRICLNPKALNRALKRCNYPMPTIDDILPHLSKAKVFSTLDARQGFTHSVLDKESSALTTFSTPFGRYRWLRLSYVLSVSPEIFQVKVLDTVSNLR